jgi:hypothetical protein
MTAQEQPATASTSAEDHAAADREILVCCAIAKASCPATCPCHPRRRICFGDRLDDFAGEVLGLLASRSVEGTFWDWPGDTEVVMARKPG